MGGRGANVSNTKVTKGDYTYTKNGANLTIKITDVKGNKILAKVAGYGPNGAFFDGNIVTTTPESEMVKGMRRKRG